MYSADNLSWVLFCFCIMLAMGLQIHSRKMNVNADVNFEELARSTDDFNGAQLKAVCVEAGMLALRRDATEVCIYLSS